MGTNSVHMLVVRFYEGTYGTAVYRDKEAVRIGRCVFTEGRIDTETLERTRLVVSKFRNAAESMGATAIEAYATCAAREASNRDELIAVVKGCGIDLRIVPGPEEARLTRLGVLGARADVRTLLIDIGGGSTEVVVADGEEDLYLDSMKLGAVRMAFASGVDQSAKVPFEKYDELRRMADMQSYRSAGRVRELGFRRAVGSSGTLVAIAEMCGARRGDDDGSYFMHYELSALMRDLCSADVEGRKKFPRMGPARADIVIGGGAVADELMNLFGVDRLEVSPNGLREGMQMDWAFRRGGRDIDIRRSSAVALAARCGADRKHYETVERYAMELYDGFGVADVIPHTDGWRELLGFAAVVHDVGEFISFDRSNIHAYTIIVNSSMAGFDMEELTDIALIARFQHDAMPKPGAAIFGPMDMAERTAILRCAMLLRLADIMDRGRDASIKSIGVAADRSAVTIDLRSDTDISMEVWKLRTAAKQFRKVFGRDLRVVFGPI